MKRAGLANQSSLRCALVVPQRRMLTGCSARCVLLAVLVSSSAVARRMWRSYDDTLGAGQRPGVFGTDIRYYFENNTDGREHGNSSRTLRWSGLHNTTATQCS